MTQTAIGLLQLLLMLAAAPMCAAWSARLRAWFQRRRGADLVRPYAGLRKLFAKEDLRPPEASVIFAAAPRAAFWATCLAAAVLPVWRPEALLQGPADFFLLAGALALGRFALSLGALGAPQVMYTTKGDANNSPDANPVAPGAVLGVYQARIPYGGYVLSALHQPITFILLIMIPVVYLVAVETRRRWIAIGEQEREAKDGGEGGRPW